MSRKGNTCQGINRGKSPKIEVVCKCTQTCNRRLTCIGNLLAWLSHDGAATWISRHQIAEIYALVLWNLQISPGLVLNVSLEQKHPQTQITYSEANAKPQICQILNRSNCTGMCNLRFACILGGTWLHGPSTWSSRRLEAEEICSPKRELPYRASLLDNWCAQCKNRKTSTVPSTK